MIRAIGQTCELEQENNPLYQAPEQYLRPLELMFAGFSKDNKLPVPKLVVPVAVPGKMVTIGMLEAATPKEQTVGGG